MNEEQNDPWQDFSESYEKAMKEIEQRQEEYWNSLSKDDQLKAFCAVVRRIVQAELKDKGSYRWALYDVFGFGPESYIQGMECGFMALHNAIYDDTHDERLLKAFCKKNNIESVDEKITKFWSIGTDHE